MALVNPLLGTWDETGVVRVFEYVGGNFVSIGTSGGFTHLTRSDMTTKGARETPFMAWDTEDTQLVVIRTETASRSRLSVLDPFAELIDATAIGGGGTTDEGYFFAQKLGADNYVTRHPAPQVTYRFDSKPLNAVSLQSIPTGASSPPRVNFFVAPNALRFIDDLGSSGNRYRLYTRDNEASPFAATLTVSGFSGFAPSLICWAADSLNIVGVDPASNRAQSWRFDPVGVKWDFVHELTMPSLGTVRRAVMSPDRRIFAISFKSGSVYKTQIYKKTGDYYQPLQVLDDIGELLDFTVDGLLLIDAANKKCFTLADETFTAAHSKVDALPGGIAQQAISAANSTQRAIGQVYTGGLKDIFDGTLDFSDLKITLLTAAATFDGSHNSKDQVTNSGAYEVTEGGWPTGGKPLQNVQIVNAGTYVSLLCDEVKHVVINSALTARRALIYEASTGLPLAFLDFVSDRVTARNKQLVLKFAGDEFMRAVR